MAKSYKSEIHAALIEHGRSFTDSVEKCCNILMQAVVDDPPQFDSRFAAHIITAILTHSLPDMTIHGDYDMWSSSAKSLASELDAGVLIDAVKVLSNSPVNWEEVVETFQQTSSFIVRDQAGLEFLMSAFTHGTPFPVELLYRPWASNRLGQLSWIGKLILHPELFCFADHAHRSLSTFCLRVMPDESNKELCNWLSLDLIEVLLVLAEEYQQAVVDILCKRREMALPDDVRSFTPALQCPDLLILGIIQLGMPLDDFRTRLLKQLVAYLMAHHTNAVPVLNMLWNTETLGTTKQVREIVVDGLACFYDTGVEELIPTRLTRIVGVAHELKPSGLAELFNSKHLFFAIDLACLASRRDFLKLDKFLDDKLSEYEAVFAHHLVNFIRRRYPSNTQQLTQEMLNVMTNAMQLRAQYTTAINPELSRLYAHLRQISAKSTEQMHMTSPRTSTNIFASQSSTPNLFACNRINEPVSGSLNANGTMTTPVFGSTSSGRPIGAGTPTTPYSPYNGGQLVPGSMDVRNPIQDLGYRTAVAPPPGWSQSSGWCSRSTPVPNQPMDFRPAFAQQQPVAGTSNSQGSMNGANSSNDFQAQAFSDEIQDEANSYFQRMFTDNEPLSVPDFIKQMAEYRDSNDPKSKDVLNCVIKNLFDEFKFFNEYPEYELKTTAEVYGSFINEGIVEHVQFAAAVRRVLEAIQSPPNTPLFTFGIVALQACKGVLHKYPKVCIMITSNDSYKKFPSDLKDYIVAGCTSELPQGEMSRIPGERSLITGSTPSQIRIDMPTSGTPSMNTVSNMEILEKGAEREGKMVVLGEEALVEQVSFICNNLSLTNLTEKVDELRRIMDKNGDKFRQWLAQYLVMKRITLEQNFHMLYNAFLISLNDVALNNFVKQETLRNIKILLKSDKKQAASNFGDRQLLKNLGYWLGIITVARNQPINLDELNLRDLLLEAFYKGQQELLYVIPFIVKVIISSVKSTIFVPSCAWIQQILQILAEIHRQSDLKLNLKFEIEVLCKELHVNLENIEDNSLLQDADRVTHLQQLSEVTRLTRPTDGSDTSLSNMSAYVPTGRASAVQANAFTPQHPGPDGDAPPVSNNFPPAVNQAPLPQFDYGEINIHESIESLVIVPEHPYFRMVPQFATAARQGIGHAVREVLHSLVERATSCALSLTMDIVNNDFHSCPDDRQMRRAFLQMMRSMTAAIGMFTSRETVSTSILTNLRQCFHSCHNAFADPSFATGMDEMVNATIDANVEMACCYVVKTACEKGLLEIEKRMEATIQKRKNGEEIPPLDIPPEIRETIERMPPDLRPRNRPLTDEEMRVYDMFSTQLCGFRMTSASIPNSYAPHKAIPQRMPKDQFSIYQPEPRMQNMYFERQGMEIDDLLGYRGPNDFQTKAEAVLREWMSAWTLSSCDVVSRGDQLGTYAVRLVQSHGVPATDDGFLRLFRTLLDICVDVSYRLIKNSGGNNNAIRQRCYFTIDAFAYLTCVLLKNTEHFNTDKVSLFHKALEIFNTSLIHHHETREFNGLPFHRILITLLMSICQLEPAGPSAKWNMLEGFGHALFFIQPRRAPAFAFHWLSIVGHRFFISQLLAEPNAPQLTRAIYTQLILAHLKFLAPSLRNVSLTKGLQDLYKGTLRVMLVVLHDFPELLCEFYYVLCDVIPPNCVQLRNLVLSAYPRNMRLPDPFGQNFASIEQLPEMESCPKIPFEMFNLIPAELRDKLDNYLNTRSSVEVLADLANRLENGSQRGLKYNIPVMNAIVSYVGVRAVQQLRDNSQRISISTIAHSSFMDVYQSLAVSFCTEGRYLLFNALANQLRYPNALTHYFACTLLYLFSSATTDIKEQITRILFERLVSLRPHPWGLLITFIELIRNEQYDFWSFDFVHCAPEIERLFVSVANSCNVPVPCIKSCN